MSRSTPDRARADPGTGPYERIFQAMLNGLAHCRMLFEGDRPVDWIYLDVNEAFKTQTGLRDLVGRRASEVIPGIRESDPGLFELFGRVARGGSPERLEMHVAAFGDWYDVSVYSPATDAFVAVFEVITGRKLQEQAQAAIARQEALAELRRSEAGLRQAQRVAHVGSWAWHIADNRVEWSDEMFRLFGLDPQGFTGDLAAVIAQAIHPDDRAAVEASKLSVIRDGRPVPLEYRILRPDGSLRTVWAEAGELLRDAEGHPAILTGIVLDITERRKSEAELRSSQEKWQKAFQHAPMLMVLSRFEDGTFLEVNDQFCQVTGYSREEVIGRSSIDLGYIEEDERARLKAAMTPLGRVENFRITTRSKDGRPLYWLMAGEGLDLGGERVLLSMAADITSLVESERLRQESEAQINHLQRMESVGRLASGIAHDINNVLSAVMGMASILQVQDAGAGPHAELILQACRRGRDLVKGLVDFARKEVQEAQPVDLNGLVRKEAEILASTTLRRVEVRVELTEDLPPILGSPTALSNALMNLCVNAVDAMPQGGTLTLGTARQGASMVELRVQDSGAGMAPEVLARATEPFYTTKPFGKGTGLGLSVVFGTVQAHGGTLELESQPGQGTVVRIALPAAQGRGGPEADGSALAAPEPQEARERRILLVDDDAMVRRTTECLLTSIGQRVVPVASGPEALDRLAQDGPFDLLVLDQAMPGMTGFQVVQAVRGQGRDLPVLLATGYADEDLWAGLQDLGRVFLLAKPYSVEELQHALRVLG